MKYFVLLSLTAALIVGSYLYMKKQEELKAQAVAQAAANGTHGASAANAPDAANGALSAQLATDAEAKLKADQAARMAEAEAAEAALAHLPKGHQQKNQDNTENIASREFRKASKEVVMEGMPLGGADGDEAKDFNYSSGYLHQKFSNKKVKAQAASISDDLLIVEGQLEDRSSRQ